MSFLHGNKEGGSRGRFRFVDDYTIREELLPNGRTVKKVYYSSEYYGTDWSKKKLRAFKLTALLGSAAAAALHLTTLGVYHDAMATIYVMLFYVLGAVSCFFMLASAIRLPFSDKPIERPDKHYGFERFRRWAVVELLSSAAGAVMDAVYCLFIVKDAVKFPAWDAGICLFGVVTALYGLYCLKTIKTANLHVLDIPSEWDKVQEAYAAEKKDNP